MLPTDPCQENKFTFPLSIIIFSSIHFTSHSREEPSISTCLDCGRDQHILGGLLLQLAPGCHYFVHRAQYQAPSPSHGASDSRVGG
ncbi:hypothetical protein L798_02166 [Zootermopsis nevadensis]|uniref:Uncharacterized protein n=1 Tax=Zootermopsis nevadensis TaxID=136037 RepID=A0A067RGM1_ZOONE|nr:hypothetical protein L798_02166 [Zootermopsis nevadensis]